MYRNMRVAFWGSSDFSMPFLKALHREHQVVVVITNPDRLFGRGLKEFHQTPVKLFAEENEIKVLQPDKLRDEGFSEKMKGLSIDLSIVVSYGKIIPEPLLSVPRYHSINVHASLLPKYRGASPIQAALANGDLITGNSIQFVSREMDKGDIICSREIKIQEDDDYHSLTDKLSEDGCDLLLSIMPSFVDHQVNAIKQDDSKANYTKLIEKENGKVSFQLHSSIEIVNKWRAYKLWPNIYFETVKPDGTLSHFVLSDIRLGPDKKGFKPGTVVQSDKSALIIACKEGTIEVLKIKPAGKKEMDFISFINGYKPEAGKLI